MLYYVNKKSKLRAARLNYYLMRESQLHVAQMNCLLMMKAQLLVTGCNKNMKLVLILAIKISRSISYYFEMKRLPADVYSDDLLNDPFVMLSILISKFATEVGMLLS